MDGLKNLRTKELKNKEPGSPPPPFPPHQWGGTKGGGALIFSFLGSCLCLRNPPLAQIDFRQRISVHRRGSLKIVRRIQELNEFLGREDHAPKTHPAERALHVVDPLLQFELRALKIFLAVGDVLGRAQNFAQAPHKRFFGGNSRRIRNHHVESLAHDIGVFDETRDVFDILAHLDAQQLVRLSGRQTAQLLQVSLDVENARMNQNLNREVQGIEKILVTVDQRILLFLRLQGEVRRGNGQNRAEAPVPHHDRVFLHFGKTQKLLGGYRRLRPRQSAALHFGFSHI